MSLSAFMDGSIWDNIDVDVVDIKREDLVFSIVAQMKCQNCGMFFRNYHCTTRPRWHRTRELLKRYEHFKLLLATDNCKERVDDMLGRKDIRSNKYIRVKCALNAANKHLVAVMRSACKMLQDHFLSKGSVFRVFGPGGGCLRCRVCNLHKTPKRPCAHPDSSWVSPEGAGVDVYKTLENLGIEFQVPPMDYLVVAAMVVYND